MQSTKSHRDLTQKNKIRKKKIHPYKSVIEKWLHHDRTYKKSAVRKILGFDSPMVYEQALATPYKYFTIYHMERIAVLVQRDFAVVVWACYEREDEGDDNLIKIRNAISRVTKG